MVTKPSNRQPVQVDPDVYGRLRTMSESTGIPITRLVNKALTAWLDTAGQQMASALAKVTKQSK